MGMAATFVMWPRPFEQAFVPLSQGSFIWNLASFGFVVIEEKSLKILNLRDFDQGQSMTLTFGTHKTSCTHLVDCIYLYIID